VIEVTLPSTKKVLAFHLSRLKDKNPQVRIQSIKELAHLGDSEALEALQALFKSDPDPEVRKAAQDAGRAIYLKQQVK
jgi:HEAT repeat protein